MSGSVFVGCDFFLGGRSFYFFFPFSVLYCGLCRALVVCVFIDLWPGRNAVMPLPLFLCRVLDWYRQAHPRPVCQSNEFLRVKKIPSLSCLASFAEDVEGVCWLGHATICVVLVLVFCVWGWLLLIKMKVAMVVMISLSAVFVFQEDTPLARWRE